MEDEYTIGDEDLDEFEFLPDEGDSFYSLSDEKDEFRWSEMSYNKFREKTSWDDLVNLDEEEELREYEE